MIVLDHLKGSCFFLCKVLLISTAIGALTTVSAGSSAEASKGNPPRATAVPNMILIPKGTFIMGSDARWPDEGPVHTVYLDSFRIDKFEVTNILYQKFVEETGRPAPEDWLGNTYPPNNGNHPVVFVTWYDANDFCHWAGKRLPTDIEWEKAARGTDGRWFPWGNDFDAKKANVPQLKLGGTTPVGSFPQGNSPYGVSDMSGNVWEWTASWYKAYAGNKRPTENYGEKYRVLKGGSWIDCSGYHCGISAPNFNRSFFNPGTKNNGFGFRCAKSL
jgi:formylglycine-generating enzyme required for sulfatase activity